VGWIGNIFKENKMDITVTKKDYLSAPPKIGHLKVHADIELETKNADGRVVKTETSLLGFVYEWQGTPTSSKGVYISSRVGTVFIFLDTQTSITKGDGSISKTPQGKYQTHLKPHNKQGDIAAGQKLNVDNSSKWTVIVVVHNPQDDWQFELQAPD
jgi:hypothetical protein